MRIQKKKQLIEKRDEDWEVTRGSRPMEVIGDLDKSIEEKR